MAAQYHSIFTEKGLELLRESIQSGTKLGITHMSFGDGNGALPTPNAAYTGMIKEVYRTQLNRLAPSKENANWLEADGVIPSAVGGFNIREVGLWAGNIMVAYANYPPTYKPTGDQGTAQIKTIRIVLQIDNTANFELKIDASVVMATIQSLNEAKAELYENTTGKVESIDDLLKLNAYEGRVVYVKSYYAGLNTGGGTRVYIESRKSENDGFLCINGWVLEVQNNTVTLEQAGAKGGNNDDAPVLRNAIDRMSRSGGGTINLTQDYYLNSYRAVDSNEICALFPNITLQAIDNSKLKVGTFFHDKPVIVFSNPWFLTTALQNFWFKDVRITSDINQNHMQTEHHLRIGVHFNSAVDCGYIGGSIDNFDCMNAIISGWIDKNGWSGTVGADFSGRVVINNVRFENLAYNSINIDHSTCYILSPHSVVKNCTFIGSEQIRKVGCSTELHNSHTTFRDNLVVDYSRGVWLAENEISNITDLLICKNRFYLANHMTIISSENKVISRVRVVDNYCECKHLDNVSSLYQGHQGLFVSSGTIMGSQPVQFEYARNTLKILHSLQEDYAVAFKMSFFATSFNIHDNEFFGVKGFIIENTSLNGWSITRNNFHFISTSLNYFGKIDNATSGSISSLTFDDNIFEFEYGGAPQYTLSILDTNTSIAACSICRNQYSKSYPKTSEVYFSKNITDLSQANRFDFKHFKCTATYSAASAKTWGIFSITPPYSMPFRTVVDVIYSPNGEKLLAGSSHYHGASKIEIPFFTLSDIASSNHDDIAIRLVTD